MLDVCVWMGNVCLGDLASLHVNDAVGELRVEQHAQERQMMYALQQQLAQVAATNADLFEELNKLKQNPNPPPAAQPFAYPTPPPQLVVVRVEGGAGGGAYGRGGYDPATNYADASIAEEKASPEVPSDFQV